MAETLTATDDRAAVYARARAHAAALSKEFDDTPLDVVMVSTAMFLYYAWRLALEPQGMTFEDFAENLGETLGRLHASRLQAEGTDDDGTHNLPVA